ncbi:MAG: hypothetical protein WBA89_16920 [Microcoleus sp.]
MQTKTFDEFRRIDAIEGQTGRGANGMTDVAWRRDAIASVLAECPVGKWILFNEFSTYVVATGHKFEVTEEPYYLYIGELGYGSLSDLERHIPQTVQQFLADVKERSNSLQDLGTVKLIECTSAHLALLIANDSRTKKFCQLAGDRTLAVPLGQETKFRTALRQMGYVLPQSDK